MIIWPYLKNIAMYTYSTFLVQSGGLLMVMNMQFVRIVHMISMLNKVASSQGMWNITKGRTY